MKSVVSFALISTLIFASQLDYSTTAVVTLVGGKIAASATDVVPAKKYKRKDCPVCKGKGWYISGDGIAKVSCGYCEPDDGSDTEESDYSHPRMTLQ